MGYSIPHFPVNLLKTPNTPNKLKMIQYQISLSKTLLHALKLKMAEYANQVKAYESHPETSAVFLKYLGVIKEKLPNSFNSKSPQPQAEVKTKPSVSVV